MNAWAYKVCWWIACLFFWCQSGMAQLKWETRLVEFKAEIGQTNFVAHFPFKNVGDKEVTIEDIKLSCTCTSAELAKKTYLPKEGGELIANFNFAGRTGSQATYLVVKTNLEPSTRLDIKGQVPNVLSISPKFLRWEIGKGLTPQTATVQIKEAGPINITSVQSSIPEFVAELKVIKPGFEYEVVITPTDTSKKSTATISFDGDPGVKGKAVYAAVREPRR
jgi:hypothetical protein